MKKSNTRSASVYRKIAVITYVYVLYFNLEALTFYERHRHFLVHRVKYMVLGQLKIHNRISMYYFGLFHRPISCRYHSI